MEVLSYFCVLQNRNSHITTKRTQFLISLNRSCSNLSCVKEVVGAVNQLSLILLVNWEDWLPCRIYVSQSSNCVLITSSALFFFSFKRICSILSSVKEAVGANVAYVPGELGRLGSWSNSCLLEPQLRAHQKKSSAFIQFQEDIQHSVLCETRCWGR